MVTVGVIFGASLEHAFHSALEKAPEPAPICRHEYRVRANEDAFEALCYVEQNGKCHGIVVLKR